MNTFITTFKRVKERYVFEALEKVREWRNMFNDGAIDEFGKKKKVTLNKAAEIVGVPKKTLEDYTQIFKKVELLANVEEFSDRKMGYLRSYLRKNHSKLRKALRLKKQEELEELRKSQASSKLDQEYSSETQSIHQDESHHEKENNSQFQNTEINLLNDLQTSNDIQIEYNELYGDDIIPINSEIDEFEQLSDKDDNEYSYNPFSFKSCSDYYHESQLI